MTAQAPDHNTNGSGKPPDHPPPPATAKAKPHGGIHTPRGWFKIHRADMVKIMENCESNAPSVFGVWAALCSLANEKADAQFTASIGIIRIRSGVSRRTAFRCLEHLEEMGMLWVEQNKAASKPHLLPNTYTIISTASKPSGGSAIDALGQCHKGTRGSAKDFKNLGTEVKEGNNGVGASEAPHPVKKHHQNSAAPALGAGAAQDGAKKRIQQKETW